MYVLGNSFQTTPVFPEKPGVSKHTPNAAFSPLNARYAKKSAQVVGLSDNMSLVLQVVKGVAHFEV